MLSNVETKWRYVFATIGGIFAGGYIGSMLATIYTMIAFREDLNTIDPLQPWFLRYSFRQLESSPSTYQVALLITCSVALALVSVGIAGVYRGSLTKYDSSHFQTPSEIRKNKMIGGFEKNGFVYGKTGKPKSKKPFISADPDRFPHTMMVAPTGSGKGVGFVLPNLLHFEGSAIVLDLKGENFKKTSVHRGLGMGNKIWYFSPYDYVDMPAMEGQDAGRRSTRTHRFNPLARVAKMKSIDEQYTAINTLADRFLVVEGDSAKGFYQAGKRLFVASCLYAIEQGQGTLGYASEVMGGGGARAKNFLRYAEQSSIPIVVRTFNEMAGETQKIVDSYVSVINGAGFELWSDPSVVKATSESDFDFDKFRSEKQTLYVAVQQEHLKTLAPLIRLLFADAVSSLQSHEPREDEPYKVLLLMDEFDSLGRQQFVLDSIKTLRSFGGRYFIVTQSIAQLDSPRLYGEIDRESLMAGAGIKVFMTPQDNRTATVLSKMLGNKTVTAISESQSRVREMKDSANVSRRSEERALLSDGHLLNEFPKDKVLILAEGQYPILAHHIVYYQDTHFAPIDGARGKHLLPYPPLDDERPRKRPKSNVSALFPDGVTEEDVLGDAEKIDAMDKMTSSMARLSDASKTTRQSAQRRGPSKRVPRPAMENGINRRDDEQAKIAEALADG